jgi:AcrR family transcriptional regulator
MMTNDEKKRDKRQRLIESAERVFSQTGYERATVDMVAADAGISKGSVYNYFSSKSELFLAVFIDRIPDEHGELMQQITATDDAAAKIEILLDWWYANGVQSDTLTPLVLEFWLSAARHEDSVILNGLRDRYFFWRMESPQVIFTPTLSRRTPRQC